MPSAFLELIGSGDTDLELVKLFLRDPRLDLECGLNFLLPPCEEGSADLVQLLLSDARIDPSLEDSVCLLTACKYGHTEVVKILLEDGRARPSALRSDSFLLACEGGHLEIVKLLANCPEVDVTVHDSKAFYTAVGGEDPALLEFLLTLYSGEDDIDIAEAFFLALCSGRESNISLLVSRGYATSVQDDPKFIKRLKMLDGDRERLAIPKIIPIKSISTNEMLQEAIRSGNSYLVELLLPDPNLEVTNTTISKAVDHDFVEVVLQLLFDPLRVPDPYKWATDHVCRVGRCPRTFVELMKYIPEFGDPKTCPEGEIRCVCAAIRRNLYETVRCFPPSFFKGKDREDEIYAALKQSDFTSEEKLEIFERFRLSFKKSMTRFRLTHACISGNAKIVRESVANARTDDLEKGVNLLVKYKHVEKLRGLFEDGTIHPSSANLKEAIVRNRKEIVTFFLGLKNPPTLSDEDFSSDIISAGNTESVEILLNHPNAPETAADLNGQALIKACKANSPKLVKLILRTGKVNPLFVQRDCIRWALVNNSVSIVKAFLKDGRVDPAFENNFLIRVSSSKGQLAIVRLLLSHTVLDPKGKEVKVIDPSASNNEAIRYAADGGFGDVVLELLRDKRVDPSKISEFTKLLDDLDVLHAIFSDARFATEKEKKQMILSKIFARVPDPFATLTLLEDPSVDPSRKDNKPLMLALSQDQVSELVIKKILDDPRVNPAARDNLALVLASQAKQNFRVFKLLFSQPAVRNGDLFRSLATACQNGNELVVRFLLSQSDVDPSEKESYSLWIACKEGKTDVVKTLLTEFPDRIDPAALDNQALAFAVEEVYLDIVKILLKDDRVDPSARGNSFAIHAVTHSMLFNFFLPLFSLPPFFSLSLSFFFAYVPDNLDILKALMASPKFDIGGCNLLSYAVDDSNSTIVKFLLSDPRIQPYFSSLFKACKERYVRIFTSSVPFFLNTCFFFGIIILT